MMRRAFVYIGGTVYPDGVTELPEKDDLILAADSGYRTAQAFGVTPRFLLGDFDSMERPAVTSETEICSFPAEKDRTDTQLAVEKAVEMGVREIVIVGGLDGRLDHTLSLLAILEDLDRRRIRAVATSGRNRARFLRNDSALILRSGFRFLSLLAADEIVKGVTMEGCKYPLKNAKLDRRMQYAISNEITGNCAFIDVRKGGVWIVESNDPT